MDFTRREILQKRRLLQDQRQLTHDLKMQMKDIDEEIATKESRISDLEDSIRGKDAELADLEEIA